MSDTASISSGVAARYATALFDLAKDAKKLPAVEKDLDALGAALADNPALQDLIKSPVYSREEAAGAVAALAKKMKLSPLLGSTLGLMAQKRRLFVVPALITAVKDMISEENGEVTADVVAAKKLTAAQEKKLAATLKKTVGKDVIINSSIDETLIGGLIVKVGSKMIDSSIKSKLSNLQNVMKEVG
ncbi:F0F1 ATP synthase subunit delta [Amylibacter marinus]|uniref:F0F1 ATP synthase subunit delta n=1 Tax=Amylibacter marinus TaxID=1475483 RepID=UPI0024E19689|nr:F0F1 ATP synthase subunit delta [Amylibacter marinus]